MLSQDVRWTVTEEDTHQASGQHMHTCVHTGTCTNTHITYHTYGRLSIVLCQKCRDWIYRPEDKSDFVTCCLLDVTWLSCSYGHMAAVVTSTRPAQDQARQSHSIGVGGMTSRPHSLLKSYWQWAVIGGGRTIVFEHTANCMFPMLQGMAPHPCRYEQH